MLCGTRLQSIFPAFSCPYADHFFDWGDKDFPVSDAACFGCLLNGFDHAGNLVLTDNDFKLDLGEKIYHVFGPPVELGMTLLSTGLGFQ